MSTKIICVAPSTRMPRTVARVVCALRETIDTFAPISELSSVDLPALGAPTSATKPQRVSLTAPLRRARNACAAACSAAPSEEVARQAGITVSPAQAHAALQAAVAAAEASAEQQGLTNATQELILAASGVPPNTATELGRYEAIANEYLKIANGGTAPTSSPAQTAAGSKLSLAECQAAKALDIAVNPQFGQLDYSQLQVVSVPNPVARPAGPATSPSPIATAPAC